MTATFDPIRVHTEYCPLCGVWLQIPIGRPDAISGDHYRVVHPSQPTLSRKAPR